MVVLFSPDLGGQWQSTGRGHSRPAHTGTMPWEAPLGVEASVGEGTGPRAANLQSKGLPGNMVGGIRAAYRVQCASKKAE